MNQVAVLGLGAMGSRMARCLIRSGHRVVVYNGTRDRALALGTEGATVADSPKEAAEQCAIVLAMVRDDDASRAVWLTPDTGAVYGLREDALAIESSTLSIRWVTELAGAIAAHGAAFLDAPVVGSRPQADTAQLIYLVGGDVTAFARAQPVLTSLAKAVHYVGPTGQGAALKLAVNALFGVQVAAVAELLAWMRGCGLDEHQTIELLGSLPVMSPAAKAAAASIFAREFAPLFPIDLMTKDLQYALAEARRANAQLPTTSAVHALFSEAHAKGFANDNLTAIARLFAGDATRE